MSYQPLTEQQAQDMMRPPLIEDGRYQFTVMEVHKTDKYHKPLADSKGGPMTRLRIIIWDNNGRERSVFTNLYWGTENKMAYRTRHYAEAVGMIEDYNAGKLLDIIEKSVGCNGYCEIYIQKGRDKNDGSGEKWPDKNDVKDFVKPVELGETKLETSKKDEFNDDIPF